MPKEETIELRHVRGVIGEKEDLPSLNARTSLTSRVRALVTKFFGVPQLIHLYGALGLNKTLTTSSGVASLFSDGTFLYSASGSVICKIDLSTFTEISSLSVSGYSLISDGTYLYAGYYIDETHPQYINRINLSDFTLKDTLEFGVNNYSFIGMVSDGTYIYAGINTEPGQITRISIETFTVVDTLTLAKNISITDLYINDSYLYVIGYIPPVGGELAKIDLGTFTEITTSLTLTYTFPYYIFSDGFYLYISAQGSANVTKIDPYLFSEVDFITLGAAALGPMFADATYLYVGSNNGNLYVVDLSTFKLVNTIAGEWISSIYSDGTYLYRGNVDNSNIKRTYIIPSADQYQRKIDITKDSVQSAISATTSAGNVGGTTLVDTARTEGNDYWNNLSVLLLGGACKGQVRRISDFDAATDTITVSPAFTAQIATSVKYEIIPTGSGTSTLVQADILSDATPFAGANITFLASTDNNYSTVAANWQTAEATVFQIAQDTRYEITGASVDLTGCTAASVWTFRFYRAYAAAGASYRIAGDTITRIVGTDNPVCEFQDWVHYGYTKITAQSNTAGDNGKTITFTWIKRTLE